MAGRPYVFPDPLDRSPNHPSIIVKPADVLGNYNRAHRDDKRERVTDPVKNWFVQEALKQGWKAAKFHGSDCVLDADVKLVK